uniref:HDC12978 n=1 Tax=Drosophila melanogaster TaxID=7227 RepID=Q6IKB2_DROME|nr:TPA_inf: HDC12978 [Drosophila melanogaster]
MCVSCPKNIPLSILQSVLLSHFKLGIRISIIAHLTYLNRNFRTSCPFAPFATEQRVISLPQPHRGRNNTSPSLSSFRLTSASAALRDFDVDIDKCSSGSSSGTTLKKSGRLLVDIAKE